MKICYCADANAVPLLRMSARTVEKFNPDAEIVVVSKERLDVPYRNILLDTSGREFIRLAGDRLTEATYYRVFLPEIGFDRCIYLDCDTLCAGSLRELWEMDVPYIGLCTTHNSGVVQAKLLHTPRYGSDAMMLMNCAALRELRFTDTMMRALPNIRRAPHGFHCAETLLNAIYFDRLTFVPMKWCKCFNRSYSAYRGEEVNFSEAVIRHYIGGQRDAQERDFKILMRRWK